MRHETVCAKTTNKIVKILDDLIEEGDYISRSQFINEAIRAHLRTWYPSKIEDG